MRSVIERPQSVVKDAFRELTKEGHADQGSNDEYDIEELERARDAILER